MLTGIITIVVFIIILSVLVLIHEAGHFFTAKKLGIKVEEFGFGFPPRVFGKKVGETIYSINALPIGGFVRLYGEDDAGSGKIGSVKDYTKLKDKDLQRAFFVRPVWQRAIVVLAGVIMNFVLALVVISYIYTFVGLPQSNGPVKITSVLVHSPAQQAGFQKNDILVSINGEKISEDTQVSAIISQHPHVAATIVVVRDKARMRLSVTPAYNAKEKRSLIGIGLSQSVILKKYPWYLSPFYGLKELVNETWQILTGLGSAVHQVSTQGTVPQGLAGPVGIEQIVGISIQAGFNQTLLLVSLLSLNLAVLNVLPIPALDGGRLFFILFEGVTGKKVNQKFEGYVHMVGMMILLTLIALLTYHDVIRLIHGEPLIPN